MLSFIFIVIKVDWTFGIYLYFCGLSMLMFCEHQVFWRAWIWFQSLTAFSINIFACIKVKVWFVNCWLFIRFVCYIASFGHRTALFLFFYRIIWRDSHIWRQILLIILLNKESVFLFYLTEFLSYGWNRTQIWISFRFRPFFELCFIIKASDFVLILLSTSVIEIFTYHRLNFMFWLFKNDFFQHILKITNNFFIQRFIINMLKLLNKLLNHLANVGSFGIVDVNLFFWNIFAAKKHQIFIWIRKKIRIAIWLLLFLIRKFYLWNVEAELFSLFFFRSFYDLFRYRHFSFLFALLQCGVS